MNYIKIFLCGVILGFTAAEVSGKFGVGSFWDLISFLFVFVAPYLLVSSQYNTNNIFNNNEILNSYGSSAMAFGFIGSIMGLIFILLGTSYPTQVADMPALLGAKIAVALITFLYGLIAKYIIVPMIQIFNK